MTDIPLVSIAMATFNGERHLREQLDSLVAQSYRPLEIVICDDASVDGTPRLLREYEGRFPGLFRIQINAANVGYVRNFEKAAMLCQGRYIAFCDQDDVWHPSKVEILVRSIGSFALVHSDAALIDENGTVLADSYTRYSRKRVRPKGFLDLVMNSPVTGCTSLFRASLVAWSGQFPRKMPHDQWIALAAFENGGIAYVPQCLTDYRQHTGNVIGAPHASSRIEKGKTLTLLFANAEKHYAAKRQALESMRDQVVKQFHPTEVSQYLRLIDYYASFFRKALRPRDLLFFLRNIGVFAYSKSAGVAAKDALFSCIGLPLFGRFVDG